MPFSRVGIGDPIGLVDVLLARNAADQRGVSAVGAVKAPLAQVTSGFGTGRWGVGGGLSSAMSAGGLTLSAEAIYWQIRESTWRVTARCGGERDVVDPTRHMLGEAHHCEIP